MKKAIIEAGAAAIVALVLLPKEDIKKDQDGIHSDLGSMDKRIHNNAVQCLLHAEKHGDTSLMRRLLVETLGGKNGYRTRGLINWMRKFSPMELKNDTVNLSGVKDGQKRPFKIAEANAMPFWLDADNDERVSKPVFQETLLSPINRVVKTITDAMENTVNGRPVDEKKPFFDGLHGDNLIDFATKVKELVDALPKDNTLEVRRAEDRVKQDQDFIRSNKVA